MDFLTRMCLVGKLSDGPGHRGAVNPGMELLAETFRTAVTEEADRAWQADRETVQADPQGRSFVTPAATGRMPVAPCTSQFEGVNA